MDYKAETEYALIQHLKDYHGYTALTYQEAIDLHNNDHRLKTLTRIGFMEHNPKLFLTKTNVFENPGAKENSSITLSTIEKSNIYELLMEYRVWLLTNKRNDQTEKEIIEDFMSWNTSYLRKWIDGLKG